MGFVYPNEGVTSRGNPKGGCDNKTSKETKGLVTVTGNHDRNLLPDLKICTKSLTVHYCVQSQVQVGPETQ